MADNYPTLSLGPYLELARDLAALLVPRHVRPEFKQSLEASLLAEARRQKALCQLAIGDPASVQPRGPLEAWRDVLLESGERRWMIGAAALGSAVSIMGIVAYLWRQRNQRVA